MGSSTPDREPLLSVRDFNVRFGGVIALDSVNFDLWHDEICGLIGPNGAGKTTLFNCITRLVDPDSGTIILDGETLGRLPRRKVIARGIARTFQNLGIYTEMTVLENVLLGAHHRARQYSMTAILDPRAGMREDADLVNSCRPILSFLGLENLSQRRAGSLPYPILRRVEIARALAAQPKVLLLDEPAAGLTHGDVYELGELLRSIRDSFGVTIWLVDHHIGLVMRLCARVMVLHLGRKIAEGTPAEIRSNSAVVNAYLGSAE